MAVEAVCRGLAMIEHPKKGVRPDIATRESEVEGKADMARVWF